MFVDRSDSIGVLTLLLGMGVISFSFSVVRAQLPSQRLSPLAVTEIATADGDVSDDPLLQWPKPLDSMRDRTEEEEDKFNASSWFLRGRLAYQRDELAKALQFYQRAWRYDPTAVSILREIVPLAFELKHNAVAARYAVIMAEQAPRDAILLRRLAQHLMDERDFARALTLYEKSLALRDPMKLDAREVLSQMEIARLYFIEGQYGKAAAAFDVVRDALEDPEKYELSDKVHTTLLGNPRVTYTLIGESFLKAGRLEQARQMFEKALSDKASAPLLAYHLARIELEDGHPRSALEQIDKYLVAKQSVAGTGPYKLLAKVLDELHEEAEATAKHRERLEALHREDPANAALAYYLADKYLEWEEADKAAELLQTTVAAEPTIAGHAALVNAQAKRKDAERLLDALGGVIEQVGSFRPLSEEFEALADDETLVNKLLKLAQARQKESGDKPNAYQAAAVGLLAIEAKKFDAADKQLAIAANSDEERQAAVLESWGLQMFLAGEYARSAKVFRRAIDEGVAKRFDGDFYYYLAAALEFGGETDAALEAAQKASEEKPDSPRYVARYAWVFYHAGRYADAEREYRKLLEKYDADHTNDEAREVAREARMILSNIAIHLDRTPDAEEWLEQVLDEYPEDVGAHNDLGYLWSDQGKRLKRSLQMIATAVAAEPDNAAYRDSLGWAHFRLGNFEQAIEHLEKAAAAIEETPDGVIMDHLGDAYLSVGRTQDAAKAWREAVELFEKDQDEESAKRARKKLDDLAKQGRGTEGE